MPEMAGTAGNQHILHSECTPFLKLMIFSEAEASRTGRGNPPARQPISGGSYTFFGVASPVFASSQQAVRAAFWLPLPPWRSYIFLLLDQCVSAGRPGQVRSRAALSRPLTPRLQQWSGETALRPISSSRTTLVQFGVKAVASRCVAALFASQAIGANAMSASPAEMPRASDPAGNDVAARR